MELDRYSVGNVVRRRRKAKGLTQDVLSSLADIQRSHLADIERGVKLPRLDTLFRLCDVLGISPHVFISEVEEESKAAYRGDK